MSQGSSIAEAKFAQYQSGNTSVFASSLLSTGQGIHLQCEPLYQLLCFLDNPNILGGGGIIVTLLPSHKSRRTPEGDEEGRNSHPTSPNLSQTEIPFENCNTMKEEDGKSLVNAWAKIYSKPSIFYIYSSKTASTQEP